MKCLRFKWLALLVMSFTTLLVMNGCGGGGGSSTPAPLEKASISGTVTFPTLNNLVAKTVAAGAPTVELRDIQGNVIKTTTATGTGPYNYSFADVTYGDYLVKIVNIGQILKAVIGKGDLSTTANTIRDLNATTTAAVIVAEQKLGVPAGTIGEKPSSISAAGIAGVATKTIENDITNALADVKTTAATQTTVNLVNLYNVVVSTVKNAIDTSAFIAGTTSIASVDVPQFTYTAANTLPTVTQYDSVTPTDAQTVVNMTAPTAVYLQYRTTESATNSVFVSGWIAADTLIYTSATLKDASGNAVPVSVTNPYKADYQVYDCFSGNSCVTGTPYQDMGFYVSFAPTLPAGNYNYELSTGTSTVIKPVTYTAVIGLPVISSSTMSATNSGTEISFAWTNSAATNWSSVGIVKLEIQDTAVNGKKVMINLKPSQTAVTLPISILEAAGLAKTSATLQWRMQTRPLNANNARGLSNWKNIPVYTPPSTATGIQAALQAGFYEFSSDWNQTTNEDNYYIRRISVSGSALSFTTPYYLDPASKAWVTTMPTGFTTDVYTYNDVALTSSGWVTGYDDPAKMSFTFNADNSATISTSAYGNLATLTASAVDVFGQAIPTTGLDGATLIANPTVFPAGSVSYDMTWTQLADEYSFWDNWGGYLGTDLAMIPSKIKVGSGSSVWVDTNNTTNSFNAQFVGGTSNEVNIYQESGAAPTKVGTATYSIKTVHGQQVLEIDIPANLRTTYSLYGGNPIFANVPGRGVMEGAHYFPGLAENGGGGSYNLIAINHIKANLNTSLMKRTAAKSFSKALLGR